MPHIDENQRMLYADLTEQIRTINIETKGDLEYLVYQLMKSYMRTRKARYSTLHDAVYATKHSADEYKRLYLDKREDQAILKNGEA